MRSTLPKVLKEYLIWGFFMLLLIPPYTWGIRQLTDNIVVEIACGFGLSFFIMWTVIKVLDED